jgi:hypothetical protein
VIERIDGMPEGTVGLRASGKLPRDDYRQVLEPALREGIAGGELRLLFVPTDFHGLEAAAVPEDIKTGLSAWFGHHSTWKRFALVTDVEWVAKVCACRLDAPRGRADRKTSTSPNRRGAWVAG